MPSTHPEFPNLRIFDHPLVQDKLTRARDVDTTPAEFRRLLNEIAGLMTYEASRDFPLADCQVQTPIETMNGQVLSQPITLVPILRAGLGMTDGILRMLPEARVGHLGCYRDESTFETVDYYMKMPPDVSDGPVLIVDPMLATGGSADYAIDRLKQLGCDNIRFICLVSAPDGVGRLLKSHPDVIVYTASLDDRLTDRKYIAPGLGDAGDRIFGTI
ncbi:MAG: uracil phosphoribosyltransferase [Phycisphaerae bacterium]|nr:uracil phosphoribosyltransferase [Phycisphaerae bacterium]